MGAQWRGWGLPSISHSLESKLKAQFFSCKSSTVDVDVRRRKMQVLGCNVARAIYHQMRLAAAADRSRTRATGEQRQQRRANPARANSCRVNGQWSFGLFSLSASLPLSLSLSRSTFFSYLSPTTTTLSSHINFHLMPVRHCALYEPCQVKLASRPACLPACLPGTMVGVYSKRFQPKLHTHCIALWLDC